MEILEAMALQRQFPFISQTLQKRTLFVRKIGYSGAVRRPSKEFLKLSALES
jgi:hypothetical protein